MLKRIILRTFTAIVILITPVLAVPPGFNVQGRLTDANGINKNGTFQITFAVYPAETGGAPVWGKTISGINVKNGTFQVLLKGLDDAGVQIENAVKDLAEAYVEIKVGSEQPMFPRQTLIRSPFSPSSISIDKVIGGNDVTIQSDSQSSGAGSIFLKTGAANRLTVLNNGNVGIGTLTPTEKLEVAGNVKAAGFYGDGSNLTGISGDNLGDHTATRALNMSNNPILNVSSLTALSASSLVSGTLADSRLSANVDLLNANQTITGVKTFASSVTVVGSAVVSNTLTVQSIMPDNFVGGIMYFAKSNCPDGFLKANGAAASRTTYAKLFSAIGTTFGAGDGSTTFNLPDMRGEFVRGADDGRGVDGGRALGTAQMHNFQGHNHSIQRTWYTNSSWETHNSATAFPGIWYGGVGAIAENIPNAVAALPITAAGYGNVQYGSETRPRNIALMSCIKY